MSQLQSTEKTVSINEKWNEQILVVKRDILFPEKSWQGLKKVDFEAYIKIIENYKEFTARGPVETNFIYKQIIPYLIFEYQGLYFIMQRKAKASEQRLSGKYTLGIGGHLRQEDLQSSDFFEWARREFYEEINYQGQFTIEPLGILNDDSNDVGKAHVGFVLLLRGDSPKISIKSELASGKLISFTQCKAHYAAMETWSQLVFDFLQSKF